jgi:hypothetical protein
MANTETTFTARKVADEVTRKLGKPVNAKRVRQWVRDHIAAFDDEGYTSHQYTPAQRAAIVKGMTTAAAKPRAKAASQGRAKPKTKPTAEAEA